MGLFRRKNKDKRKKAIAFVDFEHWYISLEKLHHQKPNIRAWREELEKDYIHGITFSGGDPLHINNAYDVSELAKEIRERYPNKTIWLYTGGTWEEVKHMRVIPYLDVLCDGEFEVDKKDENTHWVGSTNQRVIDVQRTLAEGKVVLYED